MSKGRRIGWLLVAFFLFLYVGSYLVLSRRGFAEAERYRMEGFYFFPPEDTDEWRFWNFNCVRVYYPLIKLDEVIGTGRSAAAEPLWRLSK